jgi:DNA-binding PadR family transcriptional regulator
MKETAKALLPLAPATLHILLALAEEARHGYGIMQEIARQSQGEYQLGPGTLYDNIQRLVAAKLIREVKLAKGQADSRRRYYRLTDVGRRVLAEETTRLEELVRVARARLQQPLPGRA